MIHTNRHLAGIAAVLALSGAATTQSTLAQSKPLTHALPDPIDATSNTTISSSSMWSMTSSEDGRTFKIESRDGAVTAEIDGKPVPADRIVQEGDAVRIKDDKGETIFQTQVPAANVSSNVFTVSPHSGMTLVGPRSRMGGPGGDRMIRVETAAAPPVMIGVQLLEPDASLRGHLGLKENEATMVSAVYEGLPAAAAGLEPYDIIVGIDGKSPAAPEAVRKVLRETEAGKSVSLKVIHHGQEKTVSITPEKYDPQRLDKAKINSIAAATGTPNNIGSLTMDPAWEQWAQAFPNGAAGANGQPLIATVPGQGSKPMTLWYNNLGPGGQSMNDFTKRMQEMAEQMRAQAESARRDAERLHEQLLNQSGAAPAPGALNPGMDDRMKKMEEMLQKLMEQREKQAEEKKTDARS